jgi:3'-5' exoribonuclease
MILAHHGKLEFGSPKLPMTPEAMLLSALDDLEAKFQTIRTEFAAAREAGRRPDETTEWVRSMDRNLFDSRRFLETRQDAAAGGETAAEGSDAASEDPGATEAAAVAEEDPAATDEAGGAAEAVLLSDLFPDA